MRKKKDKIHENKDVIAAVRKEESKRNFAKEKYEKALHELKEYKRLREFIGGKTAQNHHHHHDDDHLEGFLEYDDIEGDHKKKKGKRGDKSKKRGRSKKNAAKEGKGISSFTSSQANKTGVNVKVLDKSLVASQKSNAELDTTL
jgi:hypothetical protein